MLDLSPESIKTAQEKAKAARLVAQQQREANKEWLKNDYLDMPHWQQLASLYKIRMPMAGVPVSASVIRKYLKKCNVSVEQFNGHYTSMKYFVANNPLWSAQAVAGIILELKHELESR